MAKVGFWLKGARGKLGGASMGRGADGSTVIREIVTPKNPKTAAQALQRMKLGPAQKFYSAFSELLSNAFESVAYGGDSRRHFLAKIMKLEGPYIQKGVERFIPAAYPFSEGSLPSIGIEPFSGGTTVITLSVTTDKETLTNEELAALLQTTSDAQITIAVVNNVNGLFQPSYISYADRLTIAEIPENAIGVNQNGNVTLAPAAFGLDASAIVAMCVVISKQDASGKWLRSTQEMVISEELRSAIYSADAMEAAIYSYQDGTATNTINSEWYFNLGMSQAWPGKLATTTLPVKEEGEPGYANVIVGVKQLDGRIVRTVFATALTDDGLIICLSDNNEIVTYEGATVGEFKGLNIGYQYELWQDSYATQLGIYGGGQIAPTPTPTPPLPANTVYYRMVTLGTSNYKALVDAFGRLMVKVDGGNITGFAWGGTEGLPEFDNQGRYSTEFLQAYQDWGFNDGILSEEGNELIFAIDGEQYTLNYNNITNDVVPAVSAFPANGTETIFYRTLNDGNDNVVCLVNADGFLIVADNKYFTYSNEEVSTQTDATALAALTQAAGGSDEAVLVVSSDGDYSKITLDNYTIVLNMDGAVVYGGVSALPAINPLKLRVNNSTLWLTDSLGRLVVVAVPEHGSKVFNATFEDDTEKEAIATDGTLDQGDATGIATELGWDVVNLNGANYESGSYDFVSGNVTYHFDYDRTKVTPTPFSIYSNE